jgi:hyperosmotically inducible protein
MALVAIDRPGNKTASLINNTKEQLMKTLHFIKAAGSIACVAFALNATAQTSSAPPAASETMGQHIDDGTITTKVKADLLKASNVKSTHIHVKTRNGVVWLTGTVPSSDDKAAAAEVTQNVGGVQNVKNRLKVVAD